MKNYSRQREEIIKIVSSLNDHLTAEEIYFAVKKVDTSISRSTVYRNLGSLVDNNIFMKVFAGNGIDKYECIIEKGTHGHIICSKCGKISEFLGSDEIIKNIAKDTEFSDITKSSIVINGICNSCNDI